MKAELEEIVKLAPAERVERLEEFVKKNAESETRARAVEFLTSARAALGDEKLRNGDRLAGAELFRAAVAGAPAAMPDKLFYEVVSQLPANLHVLGEQEAALELARRIEAKVKDDPQRLLSVAAFYLGIERATEAARVAEAAVALKPDLAAAHLALGAAYRFSLRLDDAAREFARASELDPASLGARRSLADLLRATGKAEEALALYRERLAADAKDTGARTGLVLSLFDAGKREEAERELQSALAEQPSNLPLLVGASYWYAAHDEGVRALELAEQAVALEPRYRWVWSRVALSRALLARGRPLDAERALRPARELGRFPTLDYELASVLAAAGLYEEAAEELARSFTIKGGQIETRLAGGIAARNASFTELLAPERRAGLFQFKAADTETNARVLKGLLALHQATKTGAAKERGGRGSGGGVRRGRRRDARLPRAARGEASDAGRRRAPRRGGGDRVGEARPRRGARRAARLGRALRRRPLRRARARPRLGDDDDRARRLARADVGGHARAHRRPRGVGLVRRRRRAGGGRASAARGERAAREQHLVEGGAVAPRRRARRERQPAGGARRLRPQLPPRRARPRPPRRHRSALPPHQRLARRTRTAAHGPRPARRRREQNGPADDRGPDDEDGRDGHAAAERDDRHRPFHREDRRARSDADARPDRDARARRNNTGHRPGDIRRPFADTGADADAGNDRSHGAHTHADRDAEPRPRRPPRRRHPRPSRRALPRRRRRPRLPLRDPRPRARRGTGGRARAAR